MKKSMIQAESLGKRYRISAEGDTLGLKDSIMNIFEPKQAKMKDFWALKNVNFTIQEGETIGIIGRNGAGKSTLLKLLSRITPPTTGKIQMQGRVASLLEVGTGFHLELTGRENIYLNGAILGMTRQEIKRNFDEIVTFSEIGQFIDTPVKHYSSGMYVRLAFSVAAHLESEILIVDEVLAVGDRQFQKKCLGKMEDVGRQGRTVLFVSHNMATINELCQKSLFLEKGEVVSFGTTKDIIAEYLARDEATSDANRDISDSRFHKNKRQNSAFTFKRIALKNSQNKYTTSINLKEKFSLELEGIFHNKPADFTIGVSLHSSMGFPVFTTSITDKEATVTNAGNAIFRLEFDPNILGPGMYTLALSAGGSTILDWVPDAITFHIEQFSLHNDLVLPSNFEGIVLYPCQWSVDKVQ